MATLPHSPFDGQIYIDYQRIKWQWNSALEVWVSMGTADTFPLADNNTSGLLSAKDKVFLDAVPEVGGAFGIITPSKMLVATPHNPSGAIQGDIVLHSESLDIECVDRNRFVYTGIAQINSGDPQSGDPAPGLMFSLSDKFLSTLCLEVRGPDGPTGAKGLTGNNGKDGFTNSPQGDIGDPGDDAITTHTFTGVKIVESDEVTDTAVVELSIDQAAGILTYTIARIDVPDNEEPADKLIVIPAQRALNFGQSGTYATMDEWSLSIPQGDPISDDADLFVLGIPHDTVVGSETELTKVKLSEYVNSTITYYKGVLTTYEQEWRKEIKEYMEVKDAEARTILAAMAQRLAECEFSRPLEFCTELRIDDCTEPSDNTTVPPTTAGPTTGTTSTHTHTATTGTGTGTGTTRTTTVAPTTTAARDVWCNSGFMPKYIKVILKCNTELGSSSPTPPGRARIRCSARDACSTS